jgi:hypothetical protein
VACHFPLAVGGKLASHASCKERGEHLYSKQCYSRNVEQQTTMGEEGTMVLKNHAMFGEESSHSTITIKQCRS